MGYSQYYEIWTDELAKALRPDGDAWMAFREVWGHGSGMYGWFEELEQAELEEILAAVPAAGVVRLRELLAKAPRLPSVFLDKSLTDHEAILRIAFGSADRTAEGAAGLAIAGGERVSRDTGFRLVTHPQCEDLTARLRRADLMEALDAHVTHARCESARDDLELELRELADLYRAAAERGHQVITGVPWPPE